MNVESIYSQLDYYSDRAAYFNNQGDTEMRDFFVQQGYDLIESNESIFIDTSKL